MKLSILGLIGIEVDPNYPWKDTLFFYNDELINNNVNFDKCNVYIKVNYVKKIDAKDCRDLGNGILIGDNFIIDKEYGVKIEKQKGIFYLSTTQECNEWLIICFQLALLEQNLTFIHAAGLEKEDQVLLLPSWGGVGKTATVVRMIKEQKWKLLGDDLIIINSNGEVIPFLKPFVIYGYHKSLFPSIFSEKKAIIRNELISNWLRKMIPTLKKILRITPRVLAFLRKYNPHSIRVSPLKIFDINQLSSGGKLKQAYWLERTISHKSDLKRLKVSQLASKVTAVTIMEIFGDRINAVNVMCGNGVLQYDELYLKMYKIIRDAFNNTETFQLNISSTVPIDAVGSEVITFLNKNKVMI